MTIPKIIYGTAWKKDRTADLVYAALKTGFRGVDTACQPKHYQEELVGKGIQRAISEGIVTREDLYIQTKFTSLDGQDRTRPVPYDAAAPVATQVAQSVARSLANLGVDTLDAVLLHSPLRRQEDTLAAYRALEGFVADGKVAALGVSNIYDPGELGWLIRQARVPVKVVQNRWYEGNGWDADVYALCQKHGIMYQSFWTLTGSPNLLAARPTRTLADTQGMTPEQVVYRCCHLWNIVPLCGSTNEQHMAEALKALEGGFGADDKDVKTLRGYTLGG